MGAGALWSSRVGGGQRGPGGREQRKPNGAGFKGLGEGGVIEGKGLDRSLRRLASAQRGPGSGRKSQGFGEERWEDDGRL